MTYLDYREQTSKYQNDKTSFYPGVKQLLQPEGNRSNTTLFYSGGNQDLVQYFQRIVRLLKIDIRFEILEGNRDEQSDIQSLRFIKNIIADNKKIVLFEDIPDYLPFDESPMYLNLIESGVNPKNVAIFSRKCLALDKKTYTCSGEFGFIMKKFFFYNFPQDWMVVFANGESLPLKDWMIS